MASATACSSLQSRYKINDKVLQFGNSIMANGSFSYMVTHGCYFNGKGKITNNHTVRHYDEWW